MRLDAIIRRCKDDGVSEIELHENGRVKRIAFATKKEEVARATKKEISSEDAEEKLKAERLARRPNGYDLALRELALREAENSRGS